MEDKGLKAPPVNLRSREMLATSINLDWNRSLAIPVAMETQATSHTVRLQVGALNEIAVQATAGVAAFLLLQAKWRLGCSERRTPDAMPAEATWARPHAPSLSGPGWRTMTLLLCSGASWKAAARVTTSGPHRRARRNHPREMPVSEVSHCPPAQPTQSGLSPGRNSLGPLSRPILRPGPERKRWQG